MLLVLLLLLHRRLLRLWVRLEGIQRRRRLHRAVWGWGGHFQRAKRARLKLLFTSTFLCFAPTQIVQNNISHIFQNKKKDNRAA